MLGIKRIEAFFAVLPFSLLAFAVAWLCIAPDHLYHCWDDAPPFLISWCPPFIHPWANSVEGNLRDYFIWPWWSVYLIWFLFVGAVFLIPALAAWISVKKDPDDIA